MAETKTTKKAPKAAAAAAAPAPAAVVETPVAAAPVAAPVEAPVAAPVVEPAPVAPAVAAAPAAPAAEAASPAAFAFEMPKFELPKFELPKFDVPGFDMSKFELPKFDMTKFDIPKIDGFDKMEIPPAVTQIAEKGVEQAKAAYDKAKAALEEATDLVEDTYEVSRAGALELNTKALEAVKTNSDALFAFAREFFAVKSLAAAVELQTAFARKTFDTCTAQVKDLQETVQKVATDASKPMKDAVTKAIETVKAS